MRTAADKQFTEAELKERLNKGQRLTREEFLKRAREIKTEKSNKAKH
jgi:hypothetical protein